MTPFDPEPEPPLYNDAIAADASAGVVTSGSAPHTTTSGTEAAQNAGLDVGTAESGVDPDQRTDLEGPDQLPEDDGTLTHPSFGAGVPLHLGMGTGAGEEDVDTSAPLYDPDEDDSDAANENRGLGYIPDANGN